MEQAVAEADEMLEFSWRDGGDLESAVLEYFVSGERVAHTVLQAARQWYEGLDASDAQQTVLDFGGGYGRATRFLASALGASHRREGRGVDSGHVPVGSPGRGIAPAPIGSPARAVTGHGPLRAASRAP